MANNDHHRVTAEERELFDALLDELIEPLPGWVHDKLEEIPLVVEDYPSDAILDEMGIEDPGDLCGLHSGIPLTERSVEHSGVVGDVIHLVREGVLNASADSRGRVSETRLRSEIRITVLHEIGHHFGLDEEALDALGYA